MTFEIGFEIGVVNELKAVETELIVISAPNVDAIVNSEGKFTLMFEF